MARRPDAFAEGFAKMVNLAAAQDDATILDSLETLGGDKLDRERGLARSALLVAWEDRHGEASCEALMDRLGL